MSRKIVQVQDRLPIMKAIPLSIQHTFAMFSASVLVPLIFGIPAAVVLLMNGIGTLLFIAITKGKAPAYLGSSFAFISPVLLLMSQLGHDTGYQYALGGFIVVGIIFCIVAILIKYVGTKWIDIVLPPAAMGPVVALIGLELAGSAAQNGGLLAEEINPTGVAIFVVTIVVSVVGQVLFRGFAAAISILIAIITGYVLSAACGMIDFTPVKEANLFGMPNFMLPKFSLETILVIIPATLVVISEHIGHQVVTSKIVEKDLLKDPGLHRSLLADGISTALSGFAGSVPTTTYGENIGVMAVTKVYSVQVIGGAAIFSIILAFLAPVSALIGTIPGPVMGGISFLLYGMIGASGIRLIADARVNYAKARNLTMTALIFVIGLSGIYLQIGNVQLKGMSLAALVGMVMGVIFYLIDLCGIANDTEEPSQFS